MIGGNGLFPRVEQVCGRMEQFEIDAHVFQLVPLGQIHGVGIEAVDFGIRHGQQERGVCGDDELGAATHSGEMDDLRQTLLKLARHTVFGLVQKVQTILLDFRHQIPQAVFSVGIPLLQSAQFVRQRLHHTLFLIPSDLFYLFDTFIGGKINMTRIVLMVFHIQDFISQNTAFGCFDFVFVS